MNWFDPCSHAQATWQSPLDMQTYPAVQHTLAEAVGSHGTSLVRLPAGYSRDRLPAAGRGIVIEILREAVYYLAGGKDRKW